MVVRASFRKCDAAGDDDRAVPVAGAGRQRRDELAAAGDVDAQATVRVVDVEQPAGDDRARARARIRPERVEALGTLAEVRAALGDDAVVVRSPDELAALR